MRLCGYRTVPTASLVLLLGLMLPQCESAKILIMTTVASKSHWILESSLAKGLVDAGHDVTFITPFHDEYRPANGTGTLREVYMDGFFEHFRELLNGMDMYEITHKKGIIPTLAHVDLFCHFATESTAMTLRHPKVQQLIKSREKFDVVILEQFISESLKSLAKHFDAHLVVLSAIGPTYWINEFAGNPGAPSYSPESTFDIPLWMSFYDRFLNTITRVLLTIYMNFYYYPKHQELARQYISNDIIISEAQQNTSLFLLNTHSSVYPAVPSVPSMVYIGGFQVKPPKKLPADLQSYIDGAKDGVIYFSMGSVAQAKDMPKAKKEAVLNVFRRLKQKILWKYEEDIPNLPANVKVVPWLPQNDVLAHPNVKLFITHCGYGSMVEAIYNGKPIVAVPLFGDQPTNAATAEQFGIGIKISFRDVTEENFEAAIREVLHNSTYAENARYRSKLYKDRQIKPMDNAIYWIEYVIRHNGARHLRSNILDLAWYQYYLLDVIAYMFAVTVVPVYLVLKLCRLVCRKGKHGQKVKKN